MQTPNNNDMLLCKTPKNIIIMEELKTLKDIGFSYGKAYTSDELLSLKWKKTAIKQYGEDELRLEAIKWIKELSNSNKNKCPKGCYRYQNHNTLNGCPEHFTDWKTINWIKHFFNISERELS